MRDDASGDSQSGCATVALAPSVAGALVELAYISESAVPTGVRQRERSVLRGAYCLFSMVNTSCCGPAGSETATQEVTADGSTLPRRVLYATPAARDTCGGASGPDTCGTSLTAPEAPPQVPLPPEQRGKIHRALGDDEGDDGRWMDVPNPCEVWGGAVGLTLAMTRDPFMALVQPDSGGGKAPDAEPEGTELVEQAAPAGAALGGGVDGQAPAAEAGDAAEESQQQACVSLPAPPCGDETSPDTGVKERTASAPRATKYARDHPADAELCAPDCVGDMVTLQVQLVAAMCPLHLFVPGDGDVGKTQAGSPTTVGGPQNEATHPAASDLQPL